MLWPRALQAHATGVNTLSGSRTSKNRHGIDNRRMAGIGWQRERIK
jgi:hypothetical protein